MRNESISIHNKLRRNELRNDTSYVHIMKYMESKRELLPDFKKSVQELVPSGGELY